MKTYYELISYLDSLIKISIDNNIIDELNNFKIDLKSDRYYRFVIQLSYILNEKLKNSFDNLLSKSYDITDNDSLILELNVFKEEKDSLLSLLTINLLKDDEKEKLINELNDNYNKSLGKLRDSYDSEDTIRIIDNFIGGK